MGFFCEQQLFALAFNVIRMNFSHKMIFRMRDFEYIVWCSISNNCWSHWPIQNSFQLIFSFVERDLVSLRHLYFSFIHCVWRTTFVRSQKIQWERAISFIVDLHTTPIERESRAIRYHITWYLLQFNRNCVWFYSALVRLDLKVSSYQARCEILLLHV